MNRSRGVGALSEEVRQGSNYALRHALACTINFSYYACVQVQLAAKTLIFSLFFAGGSAGLSRSKGLLFDHGAEDRAELQGYISEPLARSTVDALNEGTKYCLPVYTSH